MRSSNSPVSELAHETVGGKRLPEETLGLFEFLKPAFDNIETAIDMVESRLHFGAHLAQQRDDHISGLGHGALPYRSIVPVRRIFFWRSSTP